MEDEISFLPFDENYIYGWILQTSNLQQKIMGCRDPILDAEMLYIKQLREENISFASLI